MVFHKLLDILPAKVSTYGGGIAQQAITDVTAHLRSKPLINRIFESFFLAINDCLWQPLLNRFLMQVLTVETAQFQPPRQSLDELQQTIVQEWHSGFERISHSGLVCDHEKVVGQVCS